MIDNKKMRNFHNQVEKIRSQENFFQNLRVNVNFQNNQGIVKSTGPDNSIIKAFLVDFRPFLLQDSNFNFGKVCNSIFKSKDNIGNQTIQSDTQKARDTWNKLLQRKDKNSAPGIGLTMNNAVINNEENLLLWLNEEYFHPDGRNKLNYITSNPVLGSASRFNFLDIVQRLSQLLFWFDKQVIQKIINDDE